LETIILFNPVSFVDEVHIIYVLIKIVSIIPQFKKTLKKNTYITLAIVVLSVVSRSKEDDPIDNPIAVNPITNKQPTGSINDLLSDKKSSRNGY
jgi:hypothetical protein